jgi:hypothetical protein
MYIKIKKGCFCLNSIRYTFIYIFIKPCFSFKNPENKHQDFMDIEIIITVFFCV